MKLHRKGLAVSLVSLAVCILFAIVFLVGEGAVSSLTDDLDALSGGERWSAAGERYATIALHTATEAALSRNQVESSAMAVDKALLEASMTADGAGSIWTYAYFTEDILSVTGPKSTANLNVMAVGGSFFTFHPLQFLAGAPFTYDRSLPYGVVLDEDAAWRIFGATDVVGMTLRMGDKDFTVTGITEKERDTDGYLRAYGDVPRMYMSYYGYEIIEGAENADITTLEVAIPDPVEGFARNIFNNAFHTNEDTMVVRENHERYTITERFRRMKELPYMGMRTDRIVYPCFENELQVIDYRSSLWMIAQTVAGAIAILALLTAVIALFASGFSPTALGRRALQGMGDAFAGSRRERSRRRERRRRKR